MDAEGAIWTGVGQMGENRVGRVREGGQVLEQVELDLPCFACMLGGEDGKTLFMLAADWRISGDGVPGDRLPSKQAVDAVEEGAGNSTVESRERAWCPRRRVALALKGSRSPVSLAPPGLGYLGARALIAVPAPAGPPGSGARSGCDTRRSPG
jgi:hypothetical protein